MNGSPTRRGSSRLGSRQRSTEWMRAVSSGSCMDSGARSYRATLLPLSRIGHATHGYSSGCGRLSVLTGPGGSV
jgi:hypothetical protein